jgi:type I restriction enzyme S subunit
MPACFPDSIVGFNANKDLCETQFIHYFIVSAKDKLASFAPATAQKNINLAILRNLLIPLHR